MEQVQHHLLRLNVAPTTVLPISTHWIAPPPRFKLAATCRSSTDSMKLFHTNHYKLGGPPLLPTFPIRHVLCRMKGSGESSIKLKNLKTTPTAMATTLGTQPIISDMTSQLELGRPEEKRKPEKRVNGIFWILLLNLGIYAADHLFHLREIKALYFYHSRPDWYQFVTATFCHANWNHLSSNLFFLYIFGKLVEEEEGSFALWTSYILTGAGANLVSWLVLPRNAVSVGASGAVFGLFAISVLVKMCWDWRKILEVLILGQFVIEKVMEAAQASAGLSKALGGGYALQSVNHIAHLSGALIGAGLVWLLSRVPSQLPDQDVSTSSRKTNKKY